MLSVAIFSRLSTDPGVTALIGAGNACRAYPHRSPPHVRTYPMVVFRCPDESDLLTQGGGEGPIEQQLEIACIANTYEQATNLHKAVKDALDAQSGIWGGIDVRGCFLHSDSEELATPPGSDPQQYIVESTYTAWHQAGA
jgi:hypothetical protein